MREHERAGVKNISLLDSVHIVPNSWPSATVESHLVEASVSASSMWLKQACGATQQNRKRVLRKDDRDLTHSWLQKFFYAAAATNPAEQEPETARITVTHAAQAVTWTSRLVLWTFWIHNIKERLGGATIKITYKHVVFLKTEEVLEKRNELELNSSVFLSCEYEQHWQLSEGYYKTQKEKKKKKQSLGVTWYPEVTNALLAPLVRERAQRFWLLGYGLCKARKCCDLCILRRDCLLLPDAPRRKTFNSILKVLLCLLGISTWNIFPMLVFLNAK